MGKKLYVGNLPYSVTDTSLKEYFAQAGTVESAKVIVDRVSARSKGYGFVEMASDQEASEAVQKFDGSNLDGRTVRVSEAKPPTPGGNRRSGGFGGRSFGGSGGVGGEGRRI